MSWAVSVARGYFASNDIYLGRCDACLEFLSLYIVRYWGRSLLVYYLLSLINAFTIPVMMIVYLHDDFAVFESLLPLRHS